MDWLAEQVGAILQDALGRGFHLPLRLVAMGINGSVLAAEYRPTKEGVGFDVEFLCEKFREGGMVLPVNIYLSDAENRAALVQMKSESAEPQWEN